MTVQSARDATISAGGTPTSMTTEDCTDSGDHLTYQVSAASKQAIDPTYPLDVFVDGDAINPGTFAVDHAHGMVTFAAEYGGHAAGPVTVTGRYVPLLDIAHATAVKVLGPEPVFADSTELGMTAPSATEVMKICTLDLTHISTADFLDDPISAFDLLYSENGPMFVAVDMGAEGTLKGWFAVASWGRDHPVAGVAPSTISLRGVVQTCVERPGTDQAIFSIR